MWAFGSPGRFRDSDRSNLKIPGMRLKSCPWSFRFLGCSKTRDGGARTVARNVGEIRVILHSLTQAGQKQQSFLRCGFQARFLGGLGFVR